MPRHRRPRRAALVLAGGLAPALAVGALAPQSGAEPVTGNPADPRPVAYEKPAAAHEGRAHARHAAFGDRAVRIASRYRGVPYVYGGSTPRGFDCSGFTRFVYKRLGKHIPRSSHDQFRHARKVGHHVRKGELVFFRSGGTGPVYHVGIYAGHGKIWHSPRSGRSVRLEKIWTRDWSAGHY